MIKIEVKRPPLGEEPSELQIDLTAEGLQYMLSQLAHLDRGTTEHIHLFSKDWGGDELTTESSLKDNIVIHHVKINMV